jgi:MFS family permease
MFFLFYAGTSAANVGINQFAVAAMTEIHGVPLTLANSVLTIYLFAVMVGVLPGGWAADKTARHGLVLAFGFGISAVLVAVVGLEGMGFWPALGLLALVGVVRGFVQASRDVMVRGIAPEGSSERCSDSPAPASSRDRLWRCRSTACCWTSARPRWCSGCRRRSRCSVSSWSCRTWRASPGPPETGPAAALVT